MAEIKSFVEINDDELDAVAGGIKDANGNWICPHCGVTFPEIRSNAACAAHWEVCPALAHRRAQ